MNVFSKIIDQIVHQNKDFRYFAANPPLQRTTESKIPAGQTVPLSDGSKLICYYVPYNRDIQF